MNDDNNVAVILDDGRKFFYADLEYHSRKLFAYINKRCVILCLCNNDFGTLLGYITFVKNRIVPIMMDSKVEENKIWNTYKEYRPDYIWAPRNKLDLHLFKEPIIEIEGYILVKTGDKYENSINDNLAILLSTSGTTGNSKMVRISYDNILSNTKSIIEYLPIQKDDVTITTLPIYYAYGMSIINTHLYIGATIVLTTKPIISEAFWQLFDRCNVTSFAGVPFTYEILEKIGFLNKKYPRLRYYTQAGGKLSYALQVRLGRYSVDNNKEFYIMYGQTEATARISYLPANMVTNKIGCVGNVIPGGEILILDKNNNVIYEANKVGELVYKGRNVALGYAYNYKDLARGDDWNGVLYTRDYARYDEEGNIYIVGRKGRFAKINGRRIALDDVEQMINEFLGATRAMCYSRDEKIYILVEGEVPSDDVIQYIQNELHILKTNIVLKEIEELPRNSAGKLEYGYNV